MGNSTTKLQDVIDFAKAKGIPVPTDSPAGYGVPLAVKLANDTMADIVAERFNPKWNRKAAAPFYTNSFQQDYPQIGLTDIGWIEDGDRVDINNTSVPKPLQNLTAYKDLSRTSLCSFPVNRYCWKYNRDLSYGTWPGQNAIYSPLIATQVKQNPLMSMIDPNGNLLIVTGFGTTTQSAVQTTTFTFAQRTFLAIPPTGFVQLFGLGTIPSWLTGANRYITVNCADARFNGTFLIVSTGTTTISGQTYWSISYQMTGAANTSTIAQEPTTGTISQYVGPVLPAGSAEGTTVLDGSVVWCVVSPDGQGFRIFPLPPAAGPVWQITAYYQKSLQALTGMSSLLNPLPDDNSRVFQTGYEAACLKSSKNPEDQKRGLQMYADWLRGLDALKKQADREPNDYGMVPASSPVASVYEYPYGLRNPQDPSQPF